MTSHRIAIVVGSALKPSALSVLVPILLAVFIVAAPPSRRIGKFRAGPSPARVAQLFGNLPISFEVNRGQWEPMVKFVARGQGYTLFLRDTEAVLSPAGGGRPVRVMLLGGNDRAEVAGREELPGKSNYFGGRDPAQWHTNVPNYAKVEYRNIYRGVNLVYYGKDAQLEHDFVVAPGADPSDIRLAIEGAKSVKLSAGGDLVLETETGEARLQAPFIYQRDQIRRRVLGGYIIGRSDKRRSVTQIGFRIGTYDKTRELVIDPVWSYAALIGGSSTFFSAPPYGFATQISGVDAGGNVAVAGSSSSDFPTVNPVSTSPGLFVFKLNALGTALIYSTFIHNAILGASTVDGAGSVYLTGFTSDPSFPITSNAMQKAFTGSGTGFVMKLSPDGSKIIYSTYFGGNNGQGGNSIAVDPFGNAYIAGGPISSPDFTVTPGAFQTKCPSAGGSTGCSSAFVSKLSGDGSTLIYSTFLGGSIEDRVMGISVDAAGSAYVTGVARSVDFPVMPGAPQSSLKCLNSGCFGAFVTKLNVTGSALVYSTYLAGDRGTIGSGIAVDSAGNAYAVGYTGSRNFPTTPGSFHPVSSDPDRSKYLCGTQPCMDQVYDGFITKLSADGTAFVYSSFVGGSGVDVVNSVAVDSSGDAYIVGGTGSWDLPTVNPIQPMAGSMDRATLLAAGCFGSACDGFLTKVSPDGSRLLISTYLGGDGPDQLFGIALDSSGGSYVLGYWGSGQSRLPSSVPGLRAAKGSTANNGLGSYAFVAKFTETNNPVVVNAVTNGASFAQGFASGGIVTIFGSGLTNVKGIVQASTLPLPTVLSGTSVLINGTAAPLFAVANVNGLEQINFQAPTGMAPPTRVTLVVVNNGISSSPAYVPVATFNMGIFMADPATPAIQHADYQPVTQSNPARRGEVLILYATGLGPVQPNPGNGNAAPVSPPATTIFSVDVTFDATCGTSFGAPLACSSLPQFSGLAPGFVGLYQVNFRVPDGVPTGNVTLAVYDANGNNSSQHVSIPVQ